MSQNNRFSYLVLNNFKTLNSINRLRNYGSWGILGVFDEDMLPFKYLRVFLNFKTKM